jgi:hypothetical protein
MRIFCVSFFFGGVELNLMIQLLQQEPKVEEPKKEEEKPKVEDKPKEIPWTPRFVTYPDYTLYYRYLY